MSQSINAVALFQRVVQLYAQMIFGPPIETGGVIKGRSVGNIVTVVAIEIKTKYRT